jgi:hypothetical protein
MLTFGDSLSRDATKTTRRDSNYREVKASHWKQFLDPAREGILWKAVTYMKPREALGCVPALQVDTDELTENEDMAQAII